jgi:hypothetical protein
MALINGRQYEFADLTLFLGGRDVTGFRGINYGSKQEKEVLYGKGNRGMSVQKGNISHDGDISFTQSELETLKALGGGTVLNLNLNAVVCYGDPSKGDVLITDKIQGLQFTKEEKQIKQGDKFMEVTLPFIALNIDYQK